MAARRSAPRKDSSSAARARPTMKSTPKRVSTRPSTHMETFANPRPGRDYEIRMEIPEFTCVCPMTGQPDFATITIRYVPAFRIVESKSLKLYLGTYRNEGIFQEHLVNTICDDLVRALDPEWIEVTGAFKSRGGIAITVVASHARSTTSPVRRAKRR